MNGSHGFRARFIAVAAAAGIFAAAAGSSPAKADLFSFDSGWGGAAGGALIGGIAGGGEGAAIGAASGAIVGAIVEDSKKKEAQGQTQTQGQQ